MARIRTKIIAIMLLVVLLPMIPISLVVYDLVKQSYHVGVNPEVEAVLSDAVQFSRQLYDMLRQQLATALEKWKLAGGHLERSHIQTVLLSTVDTSYWQIQSFMVLDQSYQPLTTLLFDSTFHWSPDPLIFEQFSEDNQHSLVISNRQENRFVALHRWKDGGGRNRYALLVARLKAPYLESANRILQVHQLFQSLSISRHFLPGRMVIAFLAIALFIVVLAVAVGISLSAKLTAPLKQLVEGTNQVGRGNLAYRIPATKRRDELGQLIEHFNAMAAQLQSDQERLIYLEKMAAWQQMARKLAHEIKNPLTPIQLTIQQLLDKYEGDDPAYRQLLQECHSIINEEINGLRRLVNEFSEFGKLPDLQLQEANLNELVQEVSVLYGERLKLELDPAVPLLRLDSDRLRRALINLIENALQADPSGHPVTVRTRIAANERITLEVEDRGVGIAPEDRKKIFEPYFSTKQEGMGLGLAITRLIVEEHGGTIEVVSEPGRGSLFRITLPVTSAGEESLSEKEEGDIP